MGFHPVVTVRIGDRSGREDGRCGRRQRLFGATVGGTPNRAGLLSSGLKLTGDELAGVVGVFGWLTREELERALAELAARAGDSPPESSAVDAAVESALDSFALVRLDDEEPRYVAGPTAFPESVNHAEDLPHILDVPNRRVDPDERATAIADPFASAVEGAVDADDGERAGRLLDASYDVEAWAPLDFEAERERLAAVIDR